jgi:hypothetical protein
VKDALSRHGLAAALFVALLVAPLAGQIFFSVSSSALEKRQYTAAPDLAALAADPPAFPGAVNAFLEDRFGFRAELIGLYAKVRDALKLGMPEVVRGDEGWLFDNLDNSLAMHQGVFPFFGDETDRWFEAPLAVKAASCGAPSVTFIVPNKHTIYAERLSRFPRRAAGRTRLETIEAEAPLRGIAMVDARTALVAAKAEGQVYYAGDTHWTPLGAYAGYRALMAALVAEGLSADPLSEDRLRTVPLDRKGDLYPMLGIADAPPERVEDIVIRDPSPVESVADLPAFDSPGFKARRIAMRDAGRPSLLFIGDSFYHGLEPFLKESFGTITLVHHSQWRASLDLLEDCAFDAVVYEQVERYLSYPGGR